MAVRRIGARGVPACVGVLAAIAFGAVSASAETFTYTGGEQECLVPAGMTHLDVVAIGGRGGEAFFGEPGGVGGVVGGELQVHPGEVLYVGVGGSALDSGCEFETQCIGGFNGGGSGYFLAAGGGGASDVQ